MRRKGFLSISFSVLMGISVKGFAQESVAIIPQSEYSIESAEHFIKMTKATQNGTMPGEKEWKELFATEGYRHFFSACRDTLFWQDNIRKAFQIVFEPAQQTRLDSILSQPVNMDTPFENYFVINLYQTEKRIDELDKFIRHTDFQDIMRQGHVKALCHLPPHIHQLRPTFKKFYFLSWDPECRAWSNGIYLDINGVSINGTEDMINTIGHELHHHYMSALLNDRYHHDTNDAAFIALCTMQQEGTADIINKQKMPLDKMPPYGPDIVKMYNDDYFSTPEVLKQLDELTTDYLAGKISQKEYAKARNCAHFGGHTTGDYMVFLIRDQLGLQTAIDCFADISAFVHRYNEAAKKADTYIFSDAFVKHVDTICQEMEQE